MPNGSYFRFDDEKIEYAFSQTIMRNSKTEYAQSQKLYEK